MSRDNWWLDFVEGEMDPSTKAQMKSLLKTSPSDQELVKTLIETRAAIKEADLNLTFDLQMSTRKQNLDDLHDRIMAEVENTAIQAPRNHFKLKPEWRRTLKNSSVVFLLLATGFLSRSFFADFFSNKSPNTQWNVPQQMAHQAIENPDEFTALMTYQSETDFFVDVASQSLDHLTKKQFESLFRSTKTR